MPIDPLNKLCKWRSIFSGWMFGSKAINAPGVQAMRDFAEKWLVMRAENNAVMQLLLAKGIVTQEEFHAQLMLEAEFLDRQMEHQFPGMRTIADGVEFYDMLLAEKTMHDKGFPE